MKCVKKDLEDLKLDPKIAGDRLQWRNCINGTVPTRDLHGKGNSKR